MFLVAFARDMVQYNRVYRPLCGASPSSAVEYAETVHRSPPSLCDFNTNIVFVDEVAMVRNEDLQQISAKLANSFKYRGSGYHDEVQGRGSHRHYVVG